MLFDKISDPVPGIRDTVLRGMAQKLYALKAADKLSNAQNLDGYLKQLRAALETEAGTARPWFRAEHFVANELDPISSERWNAAQERIYADLRTLYAALNIGYIDQAWRSESAREKFRLSKAAILAVLRELRLYEFLRANPDWQDAKFVNFSDSRNETEARPVAVVDPQTRLLELAPRAQQVQSRVQFAGSSTRITVEHLGGGRVSSAGKGFEPERAIDYHEDTFWAQMVMADGPIRQEYVPSGDAGLGSRITGLGAMCHVYLWFDRARVANSFRILPFGPFPVRVIDVAYKESDAQTDWKTLPNFRVEDPTLDWIKVHFPVTSLVSMRVTLEQSNYRTALYHLPADLVRNGHLWTRISADRQTQLLHELSLTTAEQARVDVSPSDLAILEASKEFRDAIAGSDISGGRENVYGAAVATLKAGVDSLSKIDPSLSQAALEPVQEVAPTVEKTLAVRTYEYGYGIREARLDLTLYEPMGHWASPIYRSTSSVLAVSLETEETHQAFDDGMGSYYKTSVEWEVDAGRGRRYPILPLSAVVGTERRVCDELLQINRTTRQAVTRFPLKDRAILVRENGRRLPVSAFSVQIQSTEEVASIYQTAGTDFSSGFVGQRLPASVMLGRGLVSISADEFDPNAIYTVTYLTTEAATEINLDEDLNSVDLDGPDTFESTNRNHQIRLSTFPFVDYGIIHSSEWVKIAGQAAWRFSPTQANIINGIVDLTSGSASVAGHDTTWLSQIDSSKTYAIRKRGSTKIYVVDTISGNGAITLSSPYEEETETDVEYELGQVYFSDGRAYAFDKNVYEPIRVFVNDVRATSFTDYEALEHTAFSESPRRGKQIQFIHSGDLIYFNQPIEDAKIEVHYSWLTNGIQVRGTLRCNQPAYTVITPVINSARLQMKTSRL